MPSPADASGHTEVDVVQLMLATVAVNSCLVRALLTSGAMSAQQMQEVFDAAKQELARMTTALQPDDADHLLRALWSGYVGRSKPLN